MPTLQSLAADIQIFQVSKSIPHNAANHSLLSLHEGWLKPETYVDDAAKSSLLLPQLVLHGQVSQQQQLLLDALVLG